MLKWKINARARRRGRRADPPSSRAERDYGGQGSEVSAEAVDSAPVRRWTVRPEGRGQRTEVKGQKTGRNRDAISVRKVLMANC
jgi:hypothetical protein